MSGRKVTRYLRCVLFGHGELVPIPGLWSYGCKRCVRCEDVVAEFD